MSLYDDLGSGLRAAAGTLNPGIYQEQQQVDNQKKALIAQKIIQAAENGSIKPEEAGPILQKIGYQLPANVLGPSVETQQRQAAIQNQTAMSDAVKGATDENGNLDLGKAASAVASVPGGTATALSLLEKKQAHEDAIQARKDKLAADLQNAQENRASRAQIAQLMLQGKQDIAKMMYGNTFNPNDENSQRALDTAAETFRKTGKLPQNMGRGIQGAAQATAIRSRAAELDADEGLSPEESAKKQYGFAVRQGAEKKFAFGKEGQQVTSFNKSISHLVTLEGLADALNNGDTPLFNKISNQFASQTGNPAPTNFDTAKQIVGNEIVKAIVGAGGGVGDRDKAQEVINRANSPAQLKGAIATLKELMGGQLDALEHQYKASTENDDFDKYLTKDSLPVAQEIRNKKSAPKINAPAGWTIKAK